ncbi:hypothetical protein EG68_06498 [Paragonimus skrjabini miyazakii]|uniref:Uncharacterized protein n=1 Tax=Paragonimus skrjabini miyazakii TaxID=59628 RepID=A0A8S9YUI7_9TREM|nr:hypothetical protein EG68_06498 [Paragonimus skrjabini miyazakii]
MQHCLPLFGWHSFSNRQQLEVWVIQERINGHQDLQRDSYHQLRFGRSEYFPNTTGRFTNIVHPWLIVVHFFPTTPSSRPCNELAFSGGLLMRCHFGIAL